MKHSTTKNKLASRKKAVKPSLYQTVKAGLVWALFIVFWFYTLDLAITFLA